MSSFLNKTTNNEKNIISISSLNKSQSSSSLIPNNHIKQNTSIQTTSTITRGSGGTKISKASHSYSLNKILMNANNILNRTTESSSSFSGPSGGDFYRTHKTSSSYTNNENFYGESGDTSSAANNSFNLGMMSSPWRNKSASVFYSPNIKTRKRDRILTKLGVKRNKSIFNQLPINTIDYNNLNGAGTAQSNLSASNLKPRSKQNKSANNIQETYANFMNNINQLKRATSQQDQSDDEDQGSFLFLYFFIREFQAPI
jgi:hypothetical protein